MEVTEPLDYSQNFAKMADRLDFEAKELVEEIEIKMEEELNIEKSRFYAQGIEEIQYKYRHKHWALRARFLRETELIKTQHNMSFLWAQRWAIEHVMEETKKAYCLYLQKNTKEYEELLTVLLTQALFKLREPNVLVSCLDVDLELMKRVMPRSTWIYKQVTGTSCTIYSHTHHLTPDSMGGVEVLTMNQRIKVCSTVSDWFWGITEANQVYIRNLLFPITK